MTTIDLREWRGLVSAPGLLSREPASQELVVNWHFPAPGKMRKRRGNRRLAGNAGGPVWKLHSSHMLGQQLLAHIGSTAGGNSIRVGDGTAALTTLPAIDGGPATRGMAPRMAFANTRKSHYATADEGVFRLESDLKKSRFAGMPRGRSPSYDSFPPGTLLPVGYARSYRVTIHRLTADGEELGGAPTGRTTAANSAYLGGGLSTADPVVSIQVPLEFGTTTTAIDNTYFWRLWAGRTFNEAGGELGDDEMYLVTERYFTAADIATGFISYTDVTPDSFLLSSPRLHTNLQNFSPGEAGLRQGIVNEDGPPPRANCLAYWNDVLWYADIDWRPTITVSLLANLASGDTVDVETAKGTLTLTAGVDFAPVTTAPTAAQNTRATLNRLAASLNIRSAQGGYGFTAHCVGTGTTQPAVLFLEHARPGGLLRFGGGSAYTKWQGLDGYQLGAEASTRAASNGLAYSKPLRGDAVPPINTLFADSSDATILALVPLRERMLVFTDKGIYQVTGRTTFDFSVSEFDLGKRLIGRELVAMCDERVYAWCHEGILEIDDGGVRDVSAPIGATVESVTLASFAKPRESRQALSKYGYAVGYRNRHQVRFYFPQTDAPTLVVGCPTWLSFDTQTRCWSQGQFNLTTFDGWLDARACAVVRLYDDLVIHGSWSTGADTSLFLESWANDPALDYLEDTRSGSSAPVVSSMVLQVQTPKPGAAVHWQQTVLTFEDDGDLYAMPSVVSVGINNGTIHTALPEETQVRIEPDFGARRQSSARVLLTHSQAEPCGLVGVALTYEGGTEFARRLNP